MGDYDYLLKQDEYSQKLKIETAKRILRESLIVFSGSLAIICFIISIGFLIEKSIYSSYDFNSKNLGNTYGLIVIALVCLLWTIQSLIWYAMEKQSILRGNF